MPAAAVSGATKGRPLQVQPESFVSWRMRSPHAWFRWPGKLRRACSLRRECIQLLRRHSDQHGHIADAKEINRQHEVGRSGVARWSSPAPAYRACHSSAQCENASPNMRSLRDRSNTAPIECRS